MLEIPAITACPRRCPVYPCSSVVAEDRIDLTPDSGRNGKSIVDKEIAGVALGVIRDHAIRVGIDINDVGCVAAIKARDAQCRAYPLVVCAYRRLRVGSVGCLKVRIYPETGGGAV